MSLLQVYVALPDAESIHPSAVSVVQVLQCVVALGLSDVKVSATATKVIDTVVSIIKTRLQSSESLATIVGGAEALLSSIATLKTTLTRCVMRMRCDIDSTALQMLQRDIEGDLFTSYAENIAHAELENSFRAEAVAEGPVWTTWRTDPTVGWLMNGEWHQDVPPLKEFYSNGLFEYAETLLRTWTVLTFYWGSAALWPRCKHKVSKNGADGCCDEPLLCHVTDKRHLHCAERIKRSGLEGPCGGEAAWACHRHYQQAVCKRCLGKRQTVCGGAGPTPSRPAPTGASTDIYNAVVTREESRSIGTVFHLTKVESRKAPKVAPNWRTSYRLQPSALVAVVKLSVYNEPLRREHSVHWAEVVQSTAPTRQAGSGPPVHESRFRQEGKLALRLLGRGDIATFTGEPDLPLSTQVAIIDLKVFVPEVISVLATFANPRFGEHLEQIPFARRLIGVAPSPRLLRLPPASASISEYTLKAIYNSEIRCLQMLPVEYKAWIVRDILSLPPVRNLYGTQLEAFANGIYSALHCTQGPPGTGKVIF